jgi:hypothetical protein
MRPTKLTPAIRDGIVEAVELGATWEAAAQSTGIGVSTLREWRRRGEVGEEPFVALLADLQKAEGASIARSLRVIRQAADGGQWQAAAWLLERRYPADYGRRSENRVEVSTPSSNDAVAGLLAKIAER